MPFFSLSLPVLFVSHFLLFVNRQQSRNEIVAACTYEIIFTWHAPNALTTKHQNGCRQQKHRKRTKTINNAGRVERRSLPVQAWRRSANPISAFCSVAIRNFQKVLVFFVCSSLSARLMCTQKITAHAFTFHHRYSVWTLSFRLNSIESLLTRNDSTESKWNQRNWAAAAAEWNCVEIEYRWIDRFFFSRPVRCHIARL